MEIIITNDNFQTEVLGSELPVLVDFYANWCGPCKMMEPVISALATEYAGRLKVGKVNIDKEIILAGNYGVMSIPLMIIFKNGRPLEKIIGAITKNELADKLEKYM